MDLSPLVSAARVTVQAYGDGGFKIAGQRIRGSVILLADSVLGWPCATFEDIEPDMLRDAVVAGAPEVLILGSGERHCRVGEPWRAPFRAAGIAVEAMATPAACRTYNVLAGEGRRVVAALIAVD